MPPKDSTFDRRTFLKASAAVGAGLWIEGRSSPLLAFNGSPNEKVVVGVMGLNSRGEVHLQNYPVLPNAEIAYVCDVDERALAKGVAMVGKLQARAPKPVKDFRRILEDPSVDALVIATPDHWHAPATLLALAAGKHVYVEKPCGHNPREGELLVAAARRYGRHVQQGSQQRSSARTIDALQMLREGAVGTPYLVRGWYANTRGTIGRGRPAPVPATLNYELWQGPAPRTPYRDNVIHYNWHWFRRWGTGEICNNGTHEMDVARWLLGVDYPTSVVSSGGRFHFADDWEFPDTHDATFEFEGGKSIVWHGQSCNGLPMYNRARGT
ncbi:MAG TPA: Gfo/Idh/MocA family oxidoreductase, partial [Gemmatimonadaceae bacterium]|nr:Gfo/Idh/MocA family oxidoreductase [Gemmatimonadaceae bacterium]